MAKPSTIKVCDETGKVCHASYLAALTAMKSFLKRNRKFVSLGKKGIGKGKTLMPFRCPRCQQWHLGNRGA